jgi:hypothetical protein
VAQGIRARLTAAEGRRFAFTVGAAFLVLAGIARWRGRIGVSAVMGGVGTLLIGAGLLVPARLGPVYRGWMGLAHALSRVTTPVFLAALYFVVITPSSFLVRLAGRNPLRRHRGAATYWVTRTRASSSDQMERQF